MSLFMPVSSGFLNINKPLRLTSHDVVARVRRVAGRGVKVGHAGTLDPLATGVLPVALGSATRLIAYLADARKGYRARVRLGSVTSTDDAEGEVVAKQAVPPLDQGLLDAALAPLRGEILQVPPMYSALHHEGQRLYDLARKGIEVERPARPVTIYRLELLNVEAHDTATDVIIDVECSKGTYIRALARDVGAHLACGAHLAALERTFVGAFALAESVALDTLLEQPQLLHERMTAPELAVIDWPQVILDAAQEQRVQNGMPIVATADGTQARAHNINGRLIALLRRDGERWQPEKVLG
jgi:tRNA pseudouridine55 synthase